MQRKAILEAPAEGFIDAALERKARLHEQYLERFLDKPTYEHLDALARSLRDLKEDIFRIIQYYGAGYEHGGRTFIALAEQTQTAAETLPELVKRPDGDRSALGAITRFTREIIVEVTTRCGPDVIEFPAIRESCLSPRNQGI